MVGTYEVAISSKATTKLYTYAQPYNENNDASQAKQEQPQQHLATRMFIVILLYIAVVWP